MRRCGLGALVLVAVSLFASAARAEPPTRPSSTFVCHLEGKLATSAAESAAAERTLCDALRRASGESGTFVVRVVKGEADRGFVLVVAYADGAAQRVEAVPDLARTPDVADGLARSLVDRRTKDEPTQTGRTEPGSTAARIGHRFFSVGALGIVALGVGKAGLGFSAGYFYERPSWSIGVQVVSAPEPYAGGPLFRGFLSRGDVAPYLGGGISLIAFGSSGGRELGGFVPPLGVTFEAGVSFFRHSDYRLMVGLRADLGPTGPESRPENGEEGATAQRSVVPVALGVAAEF